MAQLGRHGWWSCWERRSSSQRDVYKNKNPQSKSIYPFLVDIQSELLSDLQTRVVVPMTKLTALRKQPIRDLTPVVDMGGSSYLLLVPQLAAVATKELGEKVGSVAVHRDEIVAAMDFLVTGV